MCLDPASHRSDPGDRQTPREHPRIMRRFSPSFGFPRNFHPQCWRRNCRIGENKGNGNSARHHARGSYFLAEGVTVAAPFKSENVTNRFGDRTPKVDLLESFGVADESARMAKSEALLVIWCDL
jgi:hypothetical protein